MFIGESHDDFAVCETFGQVNAPQLIAKPSRFREGSADLLV